jgi:hypothetical protein
MFEAMIYILLPGAMLLFVWWLLDRHDGLR